MDQQNQNPQQTLTDKIKDSKNILVTVSKNPSVDQLSACLGLTLWLNKLDKHGTAVFSGEVPSTLAFLEPDQTLEKNTDSLRDFIISLDKAKADKLRYKVEDSVVKVFVTPYRTSLSVDDLEFSQGDFNIDLVIALGVHNQDELDAAITAHGRILHDATVATVTIGEAASELGAINWHDQQASSLSELVTEMTNAVDKEQLDSQIATALLTGIVAETERFSNNKTSPQTMSLSAQLMSAGANQQLVVSKLEEAPNDQPADQPEQTGDGALAVAHEETEAASEQPADTTEETTDQPEASSTEQTETTDEDDYIPAIDHFINDEEDEKTYDPLIEPAEAEPEAQPAAEQLQPAPPNWMPPQPWMTAGDPSTAAEAASEPVDQIDEPVVEETPNLDAEPTEPAVEDAAMDMPLPPQAEPAPEPVVEPAEPQQEPTQTIVPTEAGVPDVDAARDEVLRAVESAPPATPEPVAALNAQQIDLQPEQPEPVLPSPAVPSTSFDPSNFGVMNDPEVAAGPPAEPAVDPDLTGPVDQPFTLPPPPLMPPPANPLPPTSAEIDPSSPPPVPPPMAPPKL